MYPFVQFLVAASCITFLLMAGALVWAAATHDRRQKVKAGSSTCGNPDCRCESYDHIHIPRGPMMDQVDL